MRVQALSLRVQALSLLVAGQVDHRPRYYGAAMGTEAVRFLVLWMEPAVRPANGNARVECRERLGGLLNFYYRPAA
jgi:hypothetical protein